MKARYYFEAHITVEPEIHTRTLQFRKICEFSGWHVSSFLMFNEKVANDKKPKMFCSWRGTEYAVAVQAVIDMVGLLRNRNFNVLRYKIEDTLIDSKIEDHLKIVN